MRSPALVPRVRAGDQSGIGHLGGNVRGRAPQATQGLAVSAAAGFLTVSRAHRASSSGARLVELPIWGQQIGNSTTLTLLFALARPTSEVLKVVGRVVDGDHHFHDGALFATHGDGPSHLGSDQATDDG